MQWVGDKNTKEWLRASDQVVFLIAVAEAACDDDVGGVALKYRNWEQDVDYLFIMEQNGFDSCSINFKGRKI